jgi:hypothetical protein
MGTDREARGFTTRAIHGATLTLRVDRHRATALEAV